MFSKLRSLSLLRTDLTCGASLPSRPNSAIVRCGICLLTPTCRGVLRMEGMALVPEDPNLGSVIVSRNHNIQLDIGTQMMLRVPQE